MMQEYPGRMTAAIWTALLAFVWLVLGDPNPELILARAAAAVGCAP